MTSGWKRPQGRSLQLGLVGTGFVAKVRAEAIAADGRATITAVAGHHPDKARAFAATHQIAHPCASWEALVQRSDLDGIIICNINCDHAPVVGAALTADKFVVVEYPLALSPSAAAELIGLAQQRGLLLHVEHIELFGGLHQAMLTHLPKIGTPRYVRYSTAVPQRPAPQKWTYHADQFGFPLMGALSRIHRLTNLFGAVATVTSQLQYEPIADTDYFTQCRCVAQLHFRSGVVAEVLYAKGEQTWRSQRWMEVEGDRGALIFDGDQGTWLTAEGEFPLEVGSRRGLFAKDTTAVLDAVLAGHPLYVTPQESLYALQVAAEAAESAHTGTTVNVTAAYPGATLTAAS